MEKMPIKWHEDCIKNMIAYVSQLNKELESLEGKIKRLNHDILIRTKQVEKAKEMGKKEFDEGKFQRKEINYD